MKVIFGVAVIVLIGGLIFLYSKPKTNAEKYSECTHDAGVIYDTGRKKITANENGYSASEQNYYYQQTEQGYASDLSLCKQLYGS